MVEIGGKPVLWHIMKTYCAHGVTDFIICLGYKGYMIKEYFANYYLHTYMRDNSMKVHRNVSEPWTVTLIDTGEFTLTGGRLKRVAPYLDNEDFCFTYGDGVSDVNITELVEFHRFQNKLATVTAVQPAGRFGALDLSGNRITAFEEKPQGDGSWVSGGYFVLSPKVLDYIDGDATTWEDEPAQALAHAGELSAYKHNGFWHPMDTLRDNKHLNELWDSSTAPWKVW